MKRKIFLSGILSVAILSFITCSSTKKTVSISSEQQKYHSYYDDSTLTRDVLPVMMPYNRIINPAGKVISFGNPNYENHSLDIIEIPGTDLFAIEDRYGIAILNHNKIIAAWSFFNDNRYKNFMSTYSGIQSTLIEGKPHIFWSAANNNAQESKVFEAILKGNSIEIINSFDFAPEGASPLALPNEIVLNNENGKLYLYVVLNGNDKLVKINYSTKKIVWSVDTGVAPYGIVINNGMAYVTNWGGKTPDSNAAVETAGVPYGKAYIDPATGAINNGSVNVYDINTGKQVKEIPVGLHPNDIIKSNDGKWIFVSNSNSDNVSIIDVENLTVKETVSVKINPGENGFIGDSPNALAITSNDSMLYVANGMDNALAVIDLDILNKKSSLKGFIPTEAYPGGIYIKDNSLYVTNLEGEGARINSKEMTNADLITGLVPLGAYNSHHQKATVSIIPIPDDKKLSEYTEKVKDLMLHFRINLAKLAPRKNQPERPMPERIGEPSIFKHVIYIIKENRTYDQVLGDLPRGNGEKELCIFGDSVTPNQHKLAKDFILLDNYHASGKCSAEGHQWTDAAMATDYVEKNVRAWFRSYPHVQDDALVYDQKGFIWNNAADHGKSVRIYGEASMPEVDPNLSWTDFYTMFKKGEMFKFHNTTTISRVYPMLSQTYPASDYLKIPDQFRADAFIKELNEYEKLDGDQFPDLSVMALSVDHTTGTRPGMPTPECMVADNDLALGRIIDAVSKSKFWKNTVIFVTEDDSQAGWDHVSAYRTTGFVVSPYSHTGKTVSINYNQTSMVRSIEQILGIPPMNLLDATALPMFECFDNNISAAPYNYVENKIPLDRMNKPLAELKGKALYFAQQSMNHEFDHIDRGNDDLLNRILWFNSKGTQKYPSWLTGSADDDDD